MVNLEGLLRKDVLYYLAHPYSTHGDVQANLKSEEKYANHIQNYLGRHVVRPLRLVPIDLYDYQACMDICFGLLDVCGGIIMTGDWMLSTGCKMEYERSIMQNKEIILLGDESKRSTRTKESGYFSNDY